MQGTHSRPTQRPHSPRHSAPSTLTASGALYVLQARIQKELGCDHMHCICCETDFNWSAVPWQVIDTVAEAVPGTKTKGKQRKKSSAGSSTSA